MKNRKKIRSSFLILLIITLSGMCTIDVKLSYAQDVLAINSFILGDYAYVAC